MAAFALFASASFATTLTADRELRRYWRTTYDLLVRHPDAISEVERRHDLVEANHLSNNRGGISREQWESIRALPDVEVAAPIATLAYIRKHQPTVQIYDALDMGVYRLSVTSTIETGHTPVVATLDPAYGFHYLSLRDVPLEHHSAYARLGMSDMGSEDGWGFFIPLLQFNDWLLLSAIDPDEEARLLDLDQQITEGAYLQTRDVAVSAFDPPIIPLLVNQHDYIHTEDHIRIEKLSLPTDGLPTPEMIEAWGGEEYLENAPREVVWERTIMARDGLRGESLNPTVIYSDTSMAISPMRAGEIVSEFRFPAPMEYRNIDVPAFASERYDLALEANPVGITGGETVTYRWPPGEDGYALRSWIVSPETRFRSMEKGEYRSFTPSVVGLFDIESLIARYANQPNQVPLETYLPPLATLQYDESGYAVEPPATLRPALNDEGYLVSPPDLLTTLDAGELLLRDACVTTGVDGFVTGGTKPCKSAPEAFISAIRVRVEGIHQLDAAAQARIERVAQQIMSETGLHVDIMVGASPQRVLVHVPGFGDAAPVGYVEEGWIKKNVGIVVTAGVNRADSLLLGTMVLGCVLYLFNSNYLASLGRLSEFGVLRAIGWRRRELFVLVLGEALLLGATCGLAGTLLALVTVRGLHLNVPLERVLFIQPLTVITFLLGALLPARRAASAPLLTVIQHGETARDRRVRGGASLIGYALTALLHRPARTIMTLLSLALAAGLLVFLKLVLDGLGGSLYATLLGTWVRTQVAPYHFAMGVVMLLASMLAVEEVMLTNLGERRREIGLLRAVGWRRATLLMAFLFESALLGTFGGLLGTLSALAGYYLINFELPTLVATWSQVLALGLLLPLAAALLGALYPAARAARLMPLSALRGEERLVRAPHLTGVTFFLGLGGTMALVAIISAAWYYREPPHDSRFVVRGTPTPTATATLAPALAPVATPTPTVPDHMPTYHLELTVDPVSATMRGKQRIEWKYDSSVPLEQIVLHLFENAPYPIGVDEISDQQALFLEQVWVNGERVEPTYDGTFSVATLRLPTSPAFQESLTIDIDWTLEMTPYVDTPIEEWIASAFYPVLAVTDADIGACVACERDLRRIAASAYYEVTVIAPQGWTLASSVGIPETAERDASTLWTFPPTILRHFALAIGKEWQILTARSADITISLFSAPGDPQAENTLSHVSDMLAFYAERFGPLPIRNVTVVLGPRRVSGGRLYPGLLELHYREDGAPDLQLFGRKVAQQWFHILVGNDYYVEPWLAIALSEYASILYLEQEKGEAAAETYIRAAEHDYHHMVLLDGEDPPLGSGAASFEWDSRDYHNTLYAKGTLFLHTLRQTIGDDAFFAGWRAYADQHRFGMGSGAAFRQAMEQASGKDLGPVFREWGIGN